MVAIAIACVSEMRLAPVHNFIGLRACASGGVQPKAMLQAANAAR
jgi:hypothetical protein